MARVVQWIHTPDGLRQMAARIAHESCVAVDTEFVWESTYFPRLGLVQWGVADGTCFLLDPLALKDVSPLGDLLADVRIVKILHDAPQDLMILRRFTGAHVRNIMDSRLAAGFAGLPSTLSLGHLLAELMDVHLAKAHTRANWIARPLAPEVLDYAADDVYYLPQAASLLRKRAQASDVERWMDEELATLEEGGLEWVPDDKAYLRIRSASSLSQPSLAILREMAAWREQKARQTDRPRRWVLDDNSLFSIANTPPRTLDELRLAVHLPDAAWPYAEELWSAVCRGLESPAEERPEPIFQVPRDPDSRAALNAAMTHMQKCAQDRGIDPQLVCSRNEMAQFLSAGSPVSSPDHRLSRGWRAELLLA